MFQFRRFPPYTYVFSARYIESVYVGFPIRRSTDRWICAPPRGFSQLVASFIGSRCQGIRPVLLLLDLTVEAAPASSTSVCIALHTRVCFFSFSYYRDGSRFWPTKEFLLKSFLYSIFKVDLPFPVTGLEKTRTSDLALIRRAL